MYGGLKAYGGLNVTKAQGCELALGRADPKAIAESVSRKSVAGELLARKLARGVRETARHCSQLRSSRAGLHETVFALPREK